MVKTGSFLSIFTKKPIFPSIQSKFYVILYYKFQKWLKVVYFPHSIILVNLAIGSREGIKMTVFSKITQMGHEQVLFCSDETTGLKAIIAIHDTTLGPALGGCRMGL